MRINHTNRFLMNEEDGSPGGGSAPPAPAEPPATPAAAPAPEPTIPISQLKSVIGEVFGELRNGIFADLRKAGALKKDEPTPPVKQPAAAPASTGLTAAEVQQMLERDRVLTRAEVEHKLTPAQAKRMRSIIEVDGPEDVTGWVSSFVTDMGIARTDTSTPATPSTPALPNAAPISDRGAAAPAGAVGWRYELNNPIGMSTASRAQMDAELGVEKARRMRLDAARKQAETMRVAFGPQGKG
jgi:hypothetical protein